MNNELSANESYAENNFTCNCSIGYAGTLCDMDVSVCQEEAPCTNGGTCTDGVGALYNCSCAIGYTGVNCTTDVSVCDTEAPCSNGGTCSDGPGLAYNCSCALGWSGVNCSNFLCECSKLFSDYKDTYISSRSVPVHTQFMSAMPISVSLSTVADQSLATDDKPSKTSVFIFIVLSFTVATLVSSIITISILLWKLRSKPSEPEYDALSLHVK